MLERLKRTEGRRIHGSTVGVGKVGQEGVISRVGEEK